MKEWWGKGAREEDLGEGKEGVEAVDGDVVPLVETRVEVGVEERAPEDDRYHEWETGDGGVEDTMEGLERAGEAGVQPAGLAMVELEGVDTRATIPIKRE